MTVNGQHGGRAGGRHERVGGHRDGERVDDHGQDAARERLVKMQQPKDMVDENLLRAILKWSRDNCTDDAQKSLGKLMSEHREAFKKANSVWEASMGMIQGDGVEIGDAPHLQAINYLTLDQLGVLVLEMMDDVFPRTEKDVDKKRVRDDWLEGVAKARRLRNRVAHLRNVGFQDMEDLTRTLERMRRDVIDYGGWKDARVVPAEAGEPVASSEE